MTENAVYLASYHGDARGPMRWVGAAIRWVTRSEFSHCEIAVDQGDGDYLCLSASGMDGGVRVKYITLNPQRWVLTPLPHLTIVDVMREGHSVGPQPYDWAGVLRFAAPLVFRHQHPRRWFCSELCAEVMGLPDPWRWTPADLKIIAEAMAVDGAPKAP